MTDWSRGPTCSIASLGYCRITLGHPPADAVTATSVTELSELVGLTDPDPGVGR